MKNRFLHLALVSILAASCGSDGTSSLSPGAGSGTGVGGAHGPTPVTFSSSNDFVILAKTGITLKTGATANGRLLGQTAVTLDSNTIVEK